MTVCLDSWAILAWLDGEPALTRVDGVVDDRPVVSWVNLVEVHDRLERDHGRDRADETLSALRATRAAIALADCFAATTAAAHGATLLTGDPELLELADPPCAIEDLRARRS